MKKIRLGFCDMCEGFSEENNWFTKTLRKRFEIEIVSDPDFLIFSQPGKKHRRHKCIKIYFGVESFDPNWRICDYALTCNYIEDLRHFRLPLYVHYSSADRLINARHETKLELPRKFCSFVVSNAGKKKTRRRVDFFHTLNQYKKVDSGGRFLNNIGGPLAAGSASKIKFLSEYKFNIAFENKSKPGYTTEKIVEAFLAGTVPIYWGNPRIAEEFNPESFVDATSFKNDFDLVQYVRELDEDESLYRKMASQSPLKTAQVEKFFDSESLYDFFQKVFSSKTPDSRRKYFWFSRSWNQIF